MRHTIIIKSVEIALCLRCFAWRKTSLEGILGEPIEYLAYPGGFNDMLVQYVTKQSGYKMAFTVQPGTVQPGDNLYALNRLAIFQGDTPYLSFWMRLHCAPFIHYTHGHYVIFYAIMDGRD